MRSATREILLKVARFESFTGTGAASRAAERMDDAPATARPISFDPGVVSAEGLIELFEGLGLFSAEDIIAWRGTNDGAFPDADTLASKLGLDGALAARIAEAAARHELAKDASDVTTIDEVEEAPDLGAVDEPVVTEPEPREPAFAAAGSEADLPAEHAAAASEDRVRSGPPPLPVSVESEPPAASVPSRAVSVPAPAPSRRPRVYAVVAVLFVFNAALVAGAIRLHLEVKGERGPMAAVSAEVTRLQADQVGVHAKLDEARAQIEETRARLDEQTSAVTETAQRQKDAEHDARERDARDARELAALSARVSRTDRHTYKLDEAIKLIDLVEHRQPTPTGSPTDERIVPIINP